MIVKSLTIDEQPKNISTAKKLGCDIESLKGSFPHPSTSVRPKSLCHIRHLPHDKVSTKCFGGLKNLQNPHR